MKKNTSGFTLVELMIVVAIVGILSSIAYPSYVEHVLKGRRVIAQGELLAFASAMEQYYVQNGSDYRDGVVDGVAPDVYPVDGADMYTIAVTAVTASAYTIKATPNAGTAQYENGFVQIDSTGARVWEEEGVEVPHW